jgi:hypothetical protein
MRLEMGGINHQRISRPALIGKFEKYPDENTLLAPALPTAAYGLVQAVFSRRVSLPQAIAIDEDYPTQNALVVCLTSAPIGQI